MRYEKSVAGRREVGGGADGNHRLSVLNPIAHRLCDHPRADSFCLIAPCMRHRPTALPGFSFFLPGFPVVPFVSWCVRRLAQPMVSIVGQVFHLARVRQPHKRWQFWAFPLLPPISVILNSNWSYWSFDRFDSTFMGSSVLLWALFFGFTRLGHFLLVLTGFLLYLFVLGSMVISLGPAN